MFDLVLCAKGGIPLSKKKSYKQKHLLHVHQNIPLLLFPTQDQELRGLYNITQGMVYNQFQFNLPNKRCCGSSYGWLFFVDKVNKSTLDLFLINPFLGHSKTIKLPPIKFCNEDTVDRMDQYGVLKVIFSKDPNVFPQDYEVVALYGMFARLAHYKVGDKFWSYAKVIKMEALSDVIFYKDLILGVDRYNWIVNFKLEPKRRIQSTNCSPSYLKRNTLMKQLPRKLRNYAHNAYLVENSEGNLLLVRRCFWGEDVIAAIEATMAERARAIDEREIALIDEYVEVKQNESEKEPNLTLDFEVYRLYFSSNGKGLRKVRTRTLNGETIFLGDNNSISIPTSKYPQLQPNSIYYTDYYYDVYIRNYEFGSCDTGIFNLENGKIDKHYVPNFSTKGMPPPIFVVPH
ncbi:hypothetical protein Lal_00009268 [Lupinus albus]|uniref:KIB1-4 beta-propeller domain-containing protein n=1 Tax=Lupinus albus TaxID=3870 RepID=A0A6A4P190_LUPAL|nr:hypothetical protein Lalb_Chr17g0336101 [Lupinus albus]KAF1862888.1 hypothetical protein Lal_00009268 [Lupinus albus]